MESLSHTVQFISCLFGGSPLSLALPPLSITHFSYLIHQPLPSPPPPPSIAHLNLPPLLFPLTYISLNPHLLFLLFLSCSIIFIHFLLLTSAPSLIPSFSISSVPPAPPNHSSPLPLFPHEPELFLLLLITTSIFPSTISLFLPVTVHHSHPSSITFIQTLFTSYASSLLDSVFFEFSLI